MDRVAQYQTKRSAQSPHAVEDYRAQKFTFEPLIDGLEGLRAPALR